ncbi:beta-glucosidase [Motilibacter peucedani]|uniref:Beta-glucosidase n=1 Tax=Motilibacter peucedani TaxID=598650 RepID=A0A420XQD0_9ACTN|nr:glycoside hydrolase family 3 C-terminal domain-containing protein [Motilibacter peucedani]RKS75457.1 beta-glucosidase [Motilibacter peucedani]
MSPADAAPAEPSAHADLVASLDLASKVRLLSGATTFTLWPEPSVGLRELRLSDGPTGVRGLKFSGGPAVALFPNATLLASAWDEEALREVGGMLAEEALAQGIHVVLGPTINLHRTALGGRLFEAFSEDPLLTGRLAAAYVSGMQSRGVAACLKHLVANESETARNTVNSVVDEATLREVYLLPFEIAAEDARAWSMMAAYNDVNGVPATEQHHVINEVVKGEWGWDGLVMSDWFATKSAAPAANGGLELVMPGPDGPWGEALVRAVEGGEVPEAAVDDHLRRLLLLAERVGALGAEPEAPQDLPAADSPQRVEQMTRLAASGMTVLTHRGPVLPLDPSLRITLVGRHALETVDMGGGSAHVNPVHEVSVAEGLAAVLGDALTVVDGVEVRDRPVPARTTWVTDPETGEPGTHSWLYARDGSLIEHRHNDEAQRVVGFDEDFAERVATVVTRARLGISGRVELGVIGAGEWQLQAGDHRAEASLRVVGTGLGEEILAPPSTFDTVELDGSTVVETTVRLVGSDRGADDPDAPPLEGVGMFGLIARPARRPAGDAIADAVAVVAGADVAVVVVGLTEEQETEAVDKTTLALPGEQDALVRAVAAAAPRTVVVVNAATPVLMPWLDEVDAVLWAGLPGQEGGHAVAAALLGRVEPAGRLVTTFPAADGASPAWSVTPVDGDLAYDEGPFLGHRGHHAGRAPEPLFWFGHGLGLSSWEWSDAALSATGTPTVRVTNTGPRRSREVVQAYLEPSGGYVRLAGWAAVTLEPGQSAAVEVPLDRRVQRTWDAAAGAWAPAPERPAGRLLLARGLGDVRATLELHAG